jgi:hypothetical protein
MKALEFALTVLAVLFFFMIIGFLIRLADHLLEAIRKKRGKKGS